MTELIEDLQRKYNEFKEEYDFFMDFEAFDNQFGIVDQISNMKYIPKYFGRFVCSKLSDSYASWMTYLHNVVMPNPSSMILHEEANIFSEEEKKEFIEMIKKIQYHITLNYDYGINDNKEVNSKFLGAAKEFYPILLKHKKLNVAKSQAHWKKSAGY